MLRRTIKGILQYAESLWKYDLCSAHSFLFVFVFVMVCSASQTLITLWAGFLLQSHRSLVQRFTLKKITEILLHDITWIIPITFNTNVIHIYIKLHCNYEFQIYKTGRNNSSAAKQYVIVSSPPICIMHCNKLINPLTYAYLMSNYGPQTSRQSALLKLRHATHESLIACMTCECIDHAI